ncbi:type I polyketide synthase [Streptomyces sp. GSL17-111]|uniref:type I polyketide synthase n=1 Tax=Streptomyces sp. GSL17-111 TaxID=3121596 RepID=UPI0030F3CC0D
MRASAAPHETADRRGGAPQPIAVVGMAGRFPGAADVDALWESLCRGEDAIREVPAERHHLADLSSRTSGRWGGFLERVDAFDAEHFGISPREAERMDPQQRLLLETVQEAMDDAGFSADRLAGSCTGTFIGQLGNDYWSLLRRGAAPADIHQMTGSASRAVTSGRLAHVWDLRGPSLTVDTAASSSLVAVHLALQSLWSGECTTAVAGGVNLVLIPDDTVIFSEAGMLAADGRCKFGDSSADGFVRSDGVGAVILKPLQQALTDGDRVRAVVLGSAAGNDGQSSGYLVTPGVDGQEQVLRRAYRHAGVAPRDIDYVEAHGTGTGVGDPVELEALASVLGVDRPVDTPCLVGSVKSNIGHTEAAAGIAGFIKAVLCLEHGEVPASLHVDEPSPAVAGDRSPVRVPRERTPLHPQGRPAHAAVSSFGFSGTNAHVVLRAVDEEEAPPPTPESDTGPRMLLLSAANRERLHDLAVSWTRYLAPGGKGRGHVWGAVARSAAVRRELGPCRLALPAASHEDALVQLRSFVGGEHPVGGSFTEGASPHAPRIAFVYPGQGSQWRGMGRQLLSTEPVFAEAIAACDAAIREEAGWSLTDLLRTGSEDRLAEPAVVQPALWAMEVGLTALWRHWGVEPDVVIGHSMGEAAAAHAAGALSLADSAAVICRRSELAGRLSGQGSMAWVRLGAEDAAKALVGHEERVWIAARNSPASTLLSGEREALAEILRSLDRDGTPNRWVNVDFASHCPQMDTVRDELTEALREVRPRTASVPLHSTALGEVVDGSGMDAGYWARNIREPVDFLGAVTGQITDTDTVFIEISPHPVLVHSIRETAQSLGREVAAVPSLRREEDELRALLTSLAEVNTHGVSVHWPHLFDDHRFVPLPPTPWRRVSHWLPAPEAGRPAQRPDHRHIAGPGGDTAAGTWLVLADSGPHGRTLVKELRERGQRVVVATVATTLKQTGPDRYRMHPDRPDHMRTVLRDVAQRGPCSGIVHLWGLDAGLPQDATVKERERAQGLGLRSVSHLLSTLHHVPFPAPPRIWLADLESGPVDIEELVGVPDAADDTSPVHEEGVPLTARPPHPQAVTSPHDSTTSGRTATEDALEEAVVEQAGEVLGLSGRRLSVDQPLKRMGLDSLMSVELRRRIETRQGIRLSLPGPLGDHTISEVVTDLRAAHAPHAATS